jgi:hypothetical protein
MSFCPKRTMPQQSCHVDGEHDDTPRDFRGTLFTDKPMYVFLCIWVICSVYWHDAWKYYIGPKNQSKISAAQMVLARSCENCDKLLQTMGTQQNHHLHFWMEYTIYRSVCAWVSHFESLHCRSPNQVFRQLELNHLLVVPCHCITGRSPADQNPKVVPEDQTQFVWLQQP